MRPDCQEPLKRNRAVTMNPPRPDARLSGKCSAPRRDRAFFPQRRGSPPTTSPAGLAATPGGSCGLGGAAGTPPRPRGTEGGTEHTGRVLAPNLRNAFPRAPSPHAAPRADGEEAGERSPRRGGRQTATLPRGEGGSSGAHPAGHRAGAACGWEGAARGPVATGKARGFTPPRGRERGPVRHGLREAGGRPAWDGMGRQQGLPGHGGRAGEGVRPGPGEAAEPAGAASEGIPSPAGEGEMLPAGTRAPLPAPPLPSSPQPRPRRRTDAPHPPPRGARLTGAGRGRSPPPPPPPPPPTTPPPPNGRRHAHAHPHARTAPARPGRSHLLPRSEELPRTTAAAPRRLHCAGALRAPPLPAAGTGESVRAWRSAAEERRQGVAAMGQPEERPHGLPPTVPLHPPRAWHRSGQNLWGCTPGSAPPWPCTPSACLSPHSSLSRPQCRLKEPQLLLK